MEARPLLRHLTLVPIYGMCNQLRAIASARRLCLQLQARCTVVWTWGQFETFFQPMPDVEIVREIPGRSAKTVRHQPSNVDTTREVDVNVESLELHTYNLFWGSHERRAFLKDIVRFLPALHPRLQKMVDDFAGAHLNSAVGFHLRRTDHTKSVMHSPDDLFINKARELIASGKRIFLATDNVKTEAKMRRRFGDAIITYPKRTVLEQRWPRGYDQIAVEDDLVDFFLLTRTEYILGSHFSSFSGLAMAVNGSKQCQFLKAPPARIPWKGALRVALLYVTQGGKRLQAACKRL